MYSILYVESYLGISVQTFMASRNTFESVSS